MATTTAHAADRLRDHEKIERRIARNEHDRFPYVTLRFGIARARATIAWADEALEELGA